MYNAAKTAIATQLGIAKDALHIHFGLTIFVVVALIFRRTPLVAWFAVLAFELANELIDILHFHQGATQFEIGDSLKDVLNTMLWPTVAVIVLLMRKRRSAPKPDGAVARPEERQQPLP